MFLSDGSSKTQQKTFDKKIVSKTFYQKIDKKIPNRFFLDFLLSRFWAFLGEGSSKTRFKKIGGGGLTSPGTFLASEEPTNHVGVRRFFFWVPCSGGSWRAGSWSPELGGGRARPAGLGIRGGAPGARGAKAQGRRAYIRITH